MSDLIERINAPWMLWILAASTVAYTVLRQASESSAFVAQILGPLGKHWAKAREARQDTTVVLLSELAEKISNQAREIDKLRGDRDINAWNTDLKQQVEELGQAVGDLRRRNQVVDAYLVYDEEWHRKEMLAFTRADYEMSRHKSYLEFEHDWVTSKRNRRATDTKTPLDNED